MFGLLYFLGAGTAYLVSGVKASYNNAVIKEKAIQEDAAKYVSTHTYMDRRGATRDIFTNALRCTKRDEYDDVWLTDQYLDPIRNLSSAKRAVDAAILAAKAPKGTIAVKYTYWTHKTSRIKTSPLNSIEGQIYKDIETGELYIKRIFHLDENLNEAKQVGNRWDGKSKYCRYYMRLKDGLLQCPTEEMGQHDESGMLSKEEALKFIKIFNEKQKNGGWKHYAISDKPHTIKQYYLCSKDYMY